MDPEPMWHGVCARVCMHVHACVCAQPCALCVRACVCVYMFVSPFEPTSVLQ